jgi:threonine dehydrogenase-like Zn-dependent dehydrogenase
VGAAVTGFQVGDRVLIPCTTSCGRCPACRRHLLSSCEQGGWLLGNIIDGVQAEYARIPLADSSLHHLPTWIDEEAALMLADIIPTGLEVGVHSRSVELHNELLWTRNITIRMGVVNTNTIPVLLKMIKAGKLDPALLVTHRLPLSQSLAAYDIFKRAAEERAIKIVLSNEAAAPPEPTGDAALIRQIVAQVLAEL